MNADELIKMWGSARAALRLPGHRSDEVLAELRGRLLWTSERLEVGHRYTDDLGHTHIFSDMGVIVDIETGATNCVAWPLEVTDGHG